MHNYFRKPDILIPTFRAIFAEWHYLKRIELKLSQKEMAEMLGYNVNTIRAYEQKKRFPEEVDFYIECVHELEKTLKER